MHEFVCNVFLNYFLIVYNVLYIKKYQLESNKLIILLQIYRIIKNYKKVVNV